MKKIFHISLLIIIITTLAGCAQAPTPSSNENFKNFIHPRDVTLESFFKEEGLRKVDYRLRVEEYDLIKESVIDEFSTSFTMHDKDQLFLDNMFSIFYETYDNLLLSVEVSTAPLTKEQLKLLYKRIENRQIITFEVTDVIIEPIDIFFGPYRMIIYVKAVWSVNKPIRPN